MKNKKSYVKLTLDLLMGITFALLYNTRVLGGLAFHEIAGIAIGFAFVAHIILNWRFVQKVTLRLFDRSLPVRTRFSYLLNVSLLLSMTLILVSGLVISRVVLPTFQLGNENWFKIAHMSVAYLGLGLIGVHIGLHWHWVIKVLQKPLNLKLPRSLSRVLMTGVAIMVLAFGVYQVYTTNYFSRLQMLQGVFSVSSASGEGIYEHGDRNRSEFVKPQRGSENKPSFPVKGKSKGRNIGSTSWYKVLFTYTGIMAVFAGATYYLDKWIARRKKVKLAVKKLEHPGIT
ncbi:DUF4405 domain-containing protein [Paenibacillus sp. sgz5001063]|uniref:DUF4405 domain-containing protein n=1 Tax=Paenibacillus sp. sgz5001063 TaxID=3242474 RepID=UPI0036D2EA87